MFRNVLYECGGEFRESGGGRPHDTNFCGVPALQANSISRKVGIYLTQVTPTCSMFGLWKYPRNLSEFEAWFDTSRSAGSILFQLRWPEGFRCPRCAAVTSPGAVGAMQCQECGHQTSVTAGTIFQDTRKPLVDCSGPCTGWRARRTEPVPWGCRECWGWAAINGVDVAAQVARAMCGQTGIG